MNNTKSLKLILLICALGVALHINAQKKNTVIVRTTTDFYSQINPNTIFEICGTLDLRGSRVELSPNSEVILTTGRIINGELRGENTILSVKASAKIGVIMSGTWLSPIIDDSFFISDYLSDDDIFSNINNLQSQDIHNTIYLRKNKYEVSIKESGGYVLRLLDNVDLINESEIHLKGNNHKSYSIVYISRVSNINVSGGKIIGDTRSHTYQEGTSSEWGMGIKIEAAQNVTIHDMSISLCTGDGIYVSGFATSSIGDYSNSSKSIVLKNVVSDSNRRQGLSVISVDGLLVEGCSFINTGTVEGTAPSAGIDIEPNVSMNRNNSVRNIYIKDCLLEGNVGRSFEVDLSVFDGYVSNYENLIIEDCSADGQFLIGAPNVQVRRSKMESLLIRPYEAPLDVLFEDCRILGRGIIIKDRHQHEPLYNCKVPTPLVTFAMKNCSITYESDIFSQYGSVVSIEGSNKGVSVALESCMITCSRQSLNTTLLSKDNRSRVLFSKCHFRVSKSRRRWNNTSFVDCIWDTM